VVGGTPAAVPTVTGSGANNNLNVYGANAPAANFATTNDQLGAHLVYGRGCVACHAPHSGAQGNGVATSDSTSGNVALWGQDVAPLYGKVLTFGNSGHGTYAVTLPPNYANSGGAGFGGLGGVSGGNSASDGATVIMLCLSCHDGNVAKSTMMTGTTFETLPVSGGKAPTFLGSDGTTPGNYLNDHPVGPTATLSATMIGTYGWGSGTICTGSACSTAGITGNAAFTQFVANYGWTVSPATTWSGVSNQAAAVTCTTCHDQHSMSVWVGTIGGQAGAFPTMFFVRGYYNPVNGSNSTAQFCRQCHGGNSNEMHGLPNVPTI
jgi:cytochrome c553